MGAKIDNNCSFAHNSIVLFLVVYTTETRRNQHLLHQQEGGFDEMIKYVETQDLRLYKGVYFLNEVNTLDPISFPSVL